MNDAAAGFAALRVFGNCSGDTQATADQLARDNGDVARLIGHTLQRLADTRISAPRPVRMRHGMPTATALWLWDEQAIGGLVQSERTDQELGSSLRRMDRRDVESIERGDTVYEAVAVGEGRTHYRKLRVMATEGGEAVRVVPVDGKAQQPVLIMFSKLMIEIDRPGATHKRRSKLAAVPDAPAAAPAASGRHSTPPPLDDDGVALLELSRAQLGKVERDLAAAKDQRAGLRAELDAQHDKRISELEARLQQIQQEIAEAKQAQTVDRKIAEKTRGSLDEKIEHLEARRATLRQFVEASDGGSLP